MDETDIQKKGLIKVIASDVCRGISTSQVVVSLSGACKELLDNSLDAGATIIEIRVKDFGYELLEVNDNGAGIKSEDFEHLCKPHATSKLGDITDFRSLATFGFRGEALNALCAMSLVTVTTRHKSEEIGTRLYFNYKGEIVKREKCAWPFGTLVAVKKLFEPLPVRRKEFERTSRKEFNKLLIAVQSFALSRTDVRFCVNSTTNGKRHQPLLSPGGSAAIKDVIVSLFGARAEKGAVLEIVQTEPDETVSNLYSLPSDANFKDIRLSGYVSSCEHGHGRNNSDRQFVYFNKRPVDYSKLCRIANEVYQQYNAGQYCMLVLFVDVPADLIDVNVSPDKRTVFFEREKELLALLRSSLLATFAPLFGRTKSVSSCRAGEKEKQLEKKEDVKSKCSQDNVESQLTTAVGNPIIAVKENSVVEDSELFLKPALPKKTSMVVTYRSSVYSMPEESNRKRQATDSSEVVKANTKRAAVQPLEQFSFKVLQHVSPAVFSNNCNEVETSASGIAKPVGDAMKKTNCEKVESSERISLSHLVGQTTKSELILSNYEDDDFVNAESASSSSRQATPTYVPQETHERFFSEDPNKRVDSVDDSASSFGGRVRTQQRIHFSLKNLRKRVEELRSRFASSEDESRKRPSVQRASFIALDSRVAEDELTAYIKKEDFNCMKVIGQFNKGFIIAQLRGDLFIIDQHASDEKFNFERFQKKARIQSQALLRPLPLGLGAFEEALLRDHIDVFTYNGFEFQTNENAEPGQRVLLTSIPVLHNWQFNTSDIDEMLSVLREFPGTMYRPTKLRKLFALRACRKSVMIGTALTIPKMEKIIHHLGELDHPWNCPHGRPTLRHLCALEVKPLEDDGIAQLVDTAPQPHSLTKLAELQSAFTGNDVQSCDAKE